MECIGYNSGSVNGEMERSYLVEHPNFTIVGRFRNSMSIVMEEDSLVFGIPSQRYTQFLNSFHIWVQTQLVPCLHYVRKQSRYKDLLLAANVRTEFAVSYQFDPELSVGATREGLMHVQQRGQRETPLKLKTQGANRRTILRKSSYLSSTLAAHKGLSWWRPEGPHQCSDTRSTRHWPFSSILVSTWKTI